MPIDFAPLLIAEAYVHDAGDFGHRLTLLALAAFSTVWITAVGAAIGSFLNVVIYRLPRGMSLVRPKSRCPACEAPIRAGDNIPVLGWLRLRGRCRDCANPIAARYPLVEAGMALLFLGLAHYELFSGGANLPGGPERDSGLGFVLWHLNPALVGVTLYHATLLATLLCLALIAWDGFPPPRRLIAPAVLFGLAVPVFLPAAHPVLSGLPVMGLPWWAGEIAGLRLVAVSALLIEGIAGAAAGAASGGLIALSVGAGPRASAERRSAIAAGGLIGLFLGWQAAVACGLVASALAIVSAVASRFAARSAPVAGLLLAAAFIQIAFWREASRLDWWPGPGGWPILRSGGWPATGFVPASLAAAAVVAGLLALLARWIGRREESITPEAGELAATSPQP